MKRNLRFVFASIMFFSMLTTMLLFLFFSGDDKIILHTSIFCFPIISSIIWGAIRPKKRIFNVLMLLVLVIIEILMIRVAFHESDTIFTLGLDGMHMKSKKFRIELAVFPYWIIIIIGSFFALLYTLLCIGFYRISNPKEDPRSTIDFHDGLKMMTSEEGPFHISASKPLFFAGLLSKILNSKSKQ